MANTTIPQSLTIRPTLTANIVDTRTPTVTNYETNATDLEYDLNTFRSVINNFLNRDGASFPAGDWYNDIIAPVQFSTDTGASAAVRGINTLGDDLWGLQRKRILKRVSVIAADLSGVGAATFLVITGAVGVIGTTAAVGAVTSLGTVVATAGTFGQWDAAAIAGANALQPKNLITLIDDATGEPVIGTISGKQVYALIQGEATLTDGDTITVGGAGEVQFSFVVHNGGNDALIEATASDMSGITFNYAYVRRDAFQDCPEEAWLGEGFVDSGASNATRQAVYDNAPNVLTVASAVLDIGGGFVWEIGNSASAPLMTFTEAGASSTLALGSNLTTYTNSAVTNLFTNGIEVDTDNSIHIGNTTSGIDSILFTGAASVSATSGNALSVSAISGAIDITTTVGGAIDVQAVGAVTMDSSAGAITIGGDANTGAINVGTAASARTITVGNATGATALDFNSGTGGTLIDSTGVISLDAVGVSNFTTVSGNLTVSTVTSGGLIVSAADAVAISAGDEAAAAGNNISLTAGSATAGTGAGGAVISTAGDGFASGFGGNNTVTAGVGGATGDGGSTSVTAGAGGATSGFGGELTLASGTGGAAAGGGTTFLTSGDGGSTSGNGGGMNINAGSADGGGLGGILDMSAGSSVGNSNDGGTVQITAGGTSAAATTANGGDMLLGAGSAPGAGSGDGGNVVITVGSALGAGDAGQIQLVAAEGTTDNGFTNFTGSFDMADTDEFWRLSPSGAATNGPNSGGSVFVSMYAGNRDPATFISATPGSLYMRGNSTTSALYLNDTSGTGAGTDWVRIATLDDIAASNDLSEVVTNQAGTAFTAGAFDTQWGLATGQFLEFGDASNVGILTVTSAAAGASTVAIANALTFSANVTGAITLDADAASNFTVAGAALTLESTGAFDVNVTGGGAVAIQSGTTDIGLVATTSIDLTAGTTVGILSGGGDDVDITAGRDIDMAAECLRFDAPSRYGHEQWASDYHLFGDAASAQENYLTINASPVPSTTLDGGIVVITNANTFTPGETITGSNAISGADAFFDVTGGATPGVAVGDFLVAENCVPECLNGLWQVTARSVGVIEVAGFSTPVIDGMFKDDMPTDASATGTLYKADICVMRCSGGAWEVADGDSVSTLTYTALGLGNPSLNDAYIQGQSITTTAGLGPVIVTGTIDATNDLLQITAPNHTVSTAGNLLQVTGDAQSSDTLIQLTNTSTEAATGMEIINSGTGIAFEITNTSSANALLVGDGSTDHLVVSATGATTFTPDSGSSVTANVTGVGDVDFNLATGGFTVDGSGGFSVDVVTDSNLTADAGSSASPVTMTVNAVNDGSGLPTLALYANNESVGGESSLVEIDAMSVAGSGTVSINAAGSIGEVNLADDAVTTTLNLGTGAAAIPVNVATGGVGTVSIATGAFANTVDINDTTGAAATNFNAGTGGITGTTTGTVAGGTITNALGVTNTSTTAASTATTNVTSTASGASGAVLANVNVGAVVGNATGTATGNFMNDAANAGIVVANIASADSVPSNTVNIAAPPAGGTSTVNIASSGSGPSTTNIGNAGGSTTIGMVSGANTMDFTTTGMDADTDWVINFPTKNHHVGEELAITGLTNVSVYESTASKMFYNNGAAGGNYFSLYGVGDDGRTATTATTGGTFWLLNLESGTVNAPVSFVAGTGGANAIVNVAGGTGVDYATGDIIAVQGANLDINNGFYVVSGVSTDAVSVHGTLTALPAGFEGFQRQFTADTSATGSVGVAVVSGIRMATDGSIQIIEGATTSSATWTGITAAGVTLTSAVTTTGGAAATMDAAFAWSIADADNLEFLSVTGTNSLLNLNPVNLADAVTILGATEAGSTFTSGAAINVITTGLSVDGGTAANEITLGLTSAGGTANAIYASGGALVVGSSLAGTANTVTIETADSGGATGPGAITVAVGDNTTASGSGGGVTIHGADYTGGSDVIGGTGSVLVRAGNDTGGVITGTAAQASLVGGTGTGGGGIGQVVGGAATSGSAAAGGVGRVVGGAGDGAGGGGLATVAGGTAGLTGLGGGVAVTATSGGATSGGGGSVTVTSGASVVGAAGIISLVPSAGSTTQGYVTIDSALASTEELLKLDNGAGTDGAVVDLFVSDIVPVHTANAGSVAFFNDGATANTGGRMFIQVDGATGTDWRQVMTTTGTTTPRQFAQCVINTTITGAASEVAGTNLTQAKCSSGTLPTRVSGFDFDTQSMIYFNGVLMMLGTGNDVKVATIGDTDVDIHLLLGVALANNDIVTVEYNNY